jgi:RNA polymerase sigma-70 factor (ECF subfamily)
VSSSPGSATSCACSSSSRQASVDRTLIYRFVQSLVRDRALAEDLTQETFVRAQRSTAECRDGARQRTWLHSIALNLVRDDFRFAARHPAPAPASVVVDLPSGMPDAESMVLEAEMSACLADLVAQLPSAQREAVVLHDQQGLGHDEVAAVLGISLANSRVLVHRGHAALRRLIDANCVVSIGSDPVPCERRDSRTGT